MPARLEHTGLREAARSASSAALVLLFACAVAYVGHVIGLLRYPFDLDQGEGYDVNSGWLLLQGISIYTSNESWPYYSSNYPPVFSVLLVPLVHWLGPTLAAGRILSASAAILTALVIVIAVLRERGTWLGALTGGLLYLASPYVFHTTPLARVNALTELFSLLGLVLCFGRHRATIAGGLFFLVLAIFTKPTALPVMGVAVLYLLITRGVSVVPSIGFVGAIGILALGLLERMSGGGFWLNTVLGNINPWGWGQAITYWSNFSLLHAGMLVVALMGLRSLGVSRYWLYALAAMPTVIGVGKWGAGESYFLGLIVALCVLVGCALSRLSLNPLMLLLASAALIVQVGLSVHEPFSRSLGLASDLGIQAEMLGRTPTEVDAEGGWKLLEILDENPGPALIENAAFALVGGREVVGNATHLRNLSSSGNWRGDALLADIEARRFHWIVLDAQLYPEPVLRTIGRTYYLYDVVLHRGAEQWIFAPGAEEDVP